MIECDGKSIRGRVIRSRPDDRSAFIHISTEIIKAQRREVRIGCRGRAGGAAK